MRPACARIDLSALRHNLTIARQHAATARVMAVIKANGYGHGLVRVATALEGADAFGVACMEEAQALREAGMAGRIVLLEGFFAADELASIARLDLDLVVHHDWQIEALERWSDKQPLRLWLKVDSGMHRLGFAPERAVVARERLLHSGVCRGVPCLMTHFANADVREDRTTERQIERFNSATEGLPGPRSLANSAGLLGFADSRADWVRPGIMLYGVSPFAQGDGRALDLRPAMTLTTRLIAINRYRAGDCLGYGGSWCCPEPMTVGVAAIGYGDGYPRHAPSGTPVLVGGQRSQLLGRVSMDMVMVDLRGLPEVRIGDPVTLWGEGLPVEEVARHAGTIAYELLCNVSQRVRMEEAGGD